MKGLENPTCPWVCLKRHQKRNRHIWHTELHLYWMENILVECRILPSDTSAKSWNPKEHLLLKGQCHVIYLLF